MIGAVVVGAGPAGSSLALRLARAGVEVVVLERSAFPRTKVCGDYLCAGAILTLADLGVADDILPHAAPVTSISLHGFGAHVRLVLPAAGAALRRAILDERLLIHAQRAGASVQRGVFVAAQDCGASVRVLYRDGTGNEREVVARALVGADGAWSCVARRAGMASTTKPSGPWATGGELCEAGAGEELRVYIGSQGYYARNPLGGGVANSMLVAPHPVRRSDADSLVDGLTGGALRFETQTVRGMVAAGPLRYQADRVARGRTLLTGDAAELLDPFTGQGVATALALSAPAAAAVTALVRGRSSGETARMYTASWRSVVGPRRALTWVISTLIRTRFFRQRALRGIENDPLAVQALVASVSGHRPAITGLSPRELVRLLAS